uniref:Uncharacterized protein n=1 Tax=Ditylenchus dipsaci TaxID=166011 RepID=A0A915D908_9BILA
MPSKCAMVFPFSRHTSVRSLLFRNEGNKSLAIKIVSSSPEVLCVNMRNRILVCDSGDVVNVDVKLNAEKLGGEISNSELKQHFLSIYCVSTANRSHEDLAKWMKSEVHEEAELVHKLKIVRSKEFAALETVIDLHGKQGPHKPVLVPSFGVDDSDCKTAHNVDSDTETAMPLSDNEFLDLLPPNSAVHTAQDGTKCWLAQLLGNIFPIANAPASVENKQSKDSAVEPGCAGV